MTHSPDADGGVLTAAETTELVRAGKGAPPPRRLVFLDTETTGLDPTRHEVWQAAYAGEYGPVLSGMLSHTLRGADPVALTLNGYLDAVDYNPAPVQDAAMVEFEHQLYQALDGATIVAANPAFDTAMLRARWGKAPWHYRTIDLQAYAMPILGHDRPESLINIVLELTSRGYEITVPDHSAHADVDALRDCWRVLVDMAATDPDNLEPVATTEATGAPSS